MISESQQEQAALYTLGLLDADEATSFEQQLDAAPDLRELVRDLQETAALLALSGHGPVDEPTPALRDRVLAEFHADRRQPTASADPGDRPRTAAASRNAWFPWAVAALFSGFAGALLWLYLQQWGQNVDLRRDVRGYQRLLSNAQTEMARVAADDPLAKISFCALEPTPDFTTAQPHAAVIWDATHHQGKLRINRLAPPASGKDYQLWTVEAGRKDAVNAGVIHVDADGKADIAFQPGDADDKPVVAVAISLERAGGSPTNQGPILLLGKF